MHDLAIFILRFLKYLQVHQSFDELLVELELSWISHYHFANELLLHQWYSPPHTVKHESGE